MITKDNLRDFLKLSGFLGEQDELIKTYKENTNIKVNFNIQEIIYPEELTINDKATCNFIANENFVVLECIDTLLT